MSTPETIPSAEEPAVERDEHRALEVDLTKVDSPTMRRLIEEVRNDQAADISAYSRWHNRHNRSR